MERQHLRGTVSAVALLPLRVFLGITFVYAGLDKLLDPAFFDPASPTGIRAQLEGFTAVSPLAPLIEAVALPAPIAIGILMALGEIAVGLGTLTGILYRLSALGGVFISLTLLLTASWAVRPYYLGNDLPYLLGWVTLAIAGSGGVLVLGPWLGRQLGRLRAGGEDRANPDSTDDAAGATTEATTTTTTTTGGSTS
jgi:thiosulfate dehydrogenase (quinone) large subunit